MYTLKNDGTSMEPLGRPFFKIRFQLTWLPRNTRKFRWLIRLAISLIVVQHLMAFDNFIMIEPSLPNSVIRSTQVDQHSAGIELLLKP